MKIRFAHLLWLLILVVGFTAILASVMAGDGDGGGGGNIARQTVTTIHSVTTKHTVHTIQHAVQALLR